MNIVGRIIYKERIKNTLSGYEKIIVYDLVNDEYIYDMQTVKNDYNLTKFWDVRNGDKKPYNISYYIENDKCIITDITER